MRFLQVSLTASLNLKKHVDIKYRLCALDNKHVSINCTVQYDFYFVSGSVGQATVIFIDVSRVTQGCFSKARAYREHFL